MKHRHKATITILAVFMILSFFCWWLSGNWYFIFIPALVILLIEAAIRAHKAIVRYKYIPATSTTTEISTVSDHIPSPKNIIITSISQWFVKDMIQASFYANYSAIGTGTAEELHEAYNGLISQYYEAKSDNTMKEYIEVMRDIKSIEVHAAIVNCNIAILSERYSPAAAKVMRAIPPFLKYTEESYVQDINHQKAAEISNEIKYERLCKSLERLEKVQGKQKDLTPEQKQKNLIRGLMDINKVEGVKYDINTMSVLEYAIAECRLNDYVENLKDQLAKNGRSNQ